MFVCACVERWRLGLRPKRVDGKENHGTSITRKNITRKKKVLGNVCKKIQEIFNSEVAYKSSVDKK